MVFDPEFEAVLRQRAKVQIRKRMRALRASIPEAARSERSRSIVARVAQSPQFERASAIGLFWPMLDKNEVDVRPLDAIARQQAKIVCYPGTEATSGATTLRTCASVELADQGQGFLEPPPDAREAVIDDGLLVVVPALAVDASGHRIGYGSGFYDRLLARITPPACALAVAYDFQLIAEVPTTPTDMPVAFIFTDTRSMARTAT